MADNLRYHAFLVERVAMRKQLEAVGITRNWLLSKQRTPLEECQYQKNFKNKGSFSALNIKEVRLNLFILCVYMIKLHTG